MVVTVSENFVGMEHIQELCLKNGWKLVVLKMKSQKVEV
jgi:hypothetical protein